MKSNQFVPNWPYGVLLALTIFGKIVYNVGHSHGLKKGREENTIVRVEGCDHNHDGLEDIEIYCNRNRGAGQRFINQGNGIFISVHNYAIELERENRSNLIFQAEGELEAER